MLKNLINFINLTQFNLECWDGDPDKRPTIQEVVTILDSMIKSQQNYIPLDEQQPHQESNLDDSQISLNEQQPHQDSTSFTFIEKQDFDEQFNSKINSIFVKELVELFIGLINKGKSYSLFRPKLEERLSLHKATFEEIYKWLNNNYMEDLDFTFFIGYLNVSGNGMALNLNNAFYYFNKASSYPIAQYYLGICYEMGIGIKKNLQLSFEWYEKSAKETMAGKHSLALFYEKSEVEHNVKLAFDLYHETEIMVI